MDVTVRRLASSADWVAVHDLDSRAFGVHRTPELDHAEARLFDDDSRIVLAEIDGTPVGTGAAFLFDLTVPGGASLAVAGITNVAVAATHRRRGVLRAMLAGIHDRAIGDGLAVSILSASESGIYGRFGYGLASRYAEWTIDPMRAAFREPAPERSIRFVAQADAAAVLAPIYDAARRRRPGMLSRSTRWWDALLDPIENWKVGGRFFVAVADEGYVLYQLHQGGPLGRMRMVVRELLATDDDTAAALWRFTLDIDLVTRVEATVPLDEPVWWRFADPRMITTTAVRDYLFACVLDVPAALEARTWSNEIDLVLDVTGGAVPGVDDRYRLRGDTTSSSCERVGSTPDLRLSAESLGALELGGVRPSVLASAGRIEELRPGALAAADLAFPCSSAPFCTTRF